ncbi:hypothetical protein PWG71_18190 [Nocardiopsis sp. N85]|uniref:hypothetical protein n=1 Tax=Nocardiopsis sp. N85 TaxID=3029400 RepID=UPI00237F9A32|nr:hypothetical protein [Nocardiopsis sp. N85]MDE3723327.1 hypothetical protein [Nocardiopsis sp. N85]
MTSPLDDDPLELLSGPSLLPDRAEEYAEAVRDLVREVAALSDLGEWTAAESLARRAIVLIDRTAPMLTDPALPSAEASALVPLHATACARAGVDPHEVARWLLAAQANGQDVPAVSVEAYADALGPEGLAAYTASVTALDELDPPATRHGERHTPSA